MGPRRGRRGPGRRRRGSGRSAPAAGPAGAAARPRRLPPRQGLRRRRRPPRARPARRGRGHGPARRPRAGAPGCGCGAATSPSTRAWPGRRWVVPRAGPGRAAGRGRLVGRGRPRPAPGPVACGPTLAASCSTASTGPASWSVPTARTRSSGAASASPPGRRALALRGYAPTPPARRGEQVIVFGTTRQPSYAWSFDRGDGLANVGYGELLTDRRTPPTRAQLLDLLEDAAARGHGARRRPGAATTCRSRRAAGDRRAGGSCSPATPPGWSTRSPARGSTTPSPPASLAGRAAAEALAHDDGGSAGDRYRRTTTALLARHFRHTDPGRPASRPAELSWTPGSAVAGEVPAGVRRPRRARTRPGAGDPPAGARSGPTARLVRRTPRTGVLAGTVDIGMRIVSVRGALPEHRYPQQEITEAFARLVLRDDEGRAVLRAAARQRRRRHPAPAHPVGGLLRGSGTSASPTTPSSRPASSSGPGRSPTP